jgi:hypothetical protein
LARYLSFADALGLGPPFDIELGAVGLEGYSIAIDDNFDANLGPIYDDEFSERVILNETNTGAQTVALVQLFEAFCAASGYPRPASVNGFPGPS